jgi:hypothetical protein
MRAYVCSSLDPLYYHPAFAGGAFAAGRKSSIRINDMVNQIFLWLERSYQKLAQKSSSREGHVLFLWTNGECEMMIWAQQSQIHFRAAELTIR